jgi:hypothetical protein
MRMMWKPARPALVAVGLVLGGCQVGDQLFYLSLGHEHDTADAGRKDRPPILTLVYIAPEQTDVGSQVTLYALAEDPDGDPVRVGWSGAGGKVTDPKAGATTYVCEEHGEHAVIVTATDSTGLKDVKAFVIKCV